MLYKGPVEVEILTKGVVSLLVHHVGCKITLPFFVEVLEIVMKSGRLRLFYKRAKNYNWPLHAQNTARLGRFALSCPCAPPGHGVEVGRRLP